MQINISKTVNAVIDETTVYLLKTMQDINKIK